ILGGRNRGTAVSTILASGGGNPIIDVGASAQPGIAIIGTDEKLGTWYFSRDNGVHWTRLKGASVTRAWLLDTGPGTRIRFVPRPGLHRGSIPHGIVFRAWDGTTGKPGTRADTTVSGGTSAFSVMTDSAGITFSTTGSAEQNGRPKLASGTH